MEKVIIFNTDRKFIENNIDQIGGLINLYADIDIQFLMDIKPADYNFINSVKHLKITEKDVFNMNFAKEGSIVECPTDTFLVSAELLTKIALDQNIRTEDIVKLIIANKKKVMLRVNESMKEFNRNRGSLSIMDKLFDVLGSFPKEIIEKYICVNYHFDAGVNTTTNEHIDDMIKTIRSSMANLHKASVPIYVSGNINTSNLLSYCVTNNIDGFIIDDKNLSVESMIEGVRMVHEWQRVIRNQIMRRNKK